MCSWQLAGWRRVRDGHHMQREKFMQMFRNTKAYGVLEEVHAGPIGLLFW